MKSSVSTWALAGALLASLTWQLRPLAARPGPSPEVCSTSCSSGTGCEPSDPSCLASISDRLEPERRRALAECCTESCAEMGRAQDEVEALFLELTDELNRDGFRPEVLRELVDRISARRRAALHASVDTLVEVRDELRPEELEALIRACPPLAGR